MFHVGKKILLGAFLAAMLFFPTRAHAVDVHWGLFGTGALTKSNSDVGYLSNTITQGMSFNPDSIAGINAQVSISDSWDGVVQLVAPGLNQFNVQAEWAFLAYHANNEFTVRAGLQRLPVWLFSDRKNVSFLFPWVRLPQEVYDTNPVESYGGASVTWKKSFGDWQVRSEAYGGAIDTTVNRPSRTTALDLSDLKGITVTLESPALTFRVGYVDTKISIVPSFPSYTPISPGLSVQNTVTVVYPVSHVDFFSLGLAFDWKGIVSYAEYAREGSDSPLITGRQSGYVMLGYRLGRVLPYYTFSMIDDRRSGPAIGAELEHIVGFRVLLNDQIDFKGEWEEIHVLDQDGLFVSPPTGYVGVWSVAVDFVY